MVETQGKSNFSTTIIIIIEIHLTCAFLATEQSNLVDDAKYGGRRGGYGHGRGGHGGRGGGLGGGPQGNEAKPQN